MPRSAAHRGSSSLTDGVLAGDAELAATRRARAERQKSWRSRRRRRPPRCSRRRRRSGSSSVPRGAGRPRARAAAATPPAPPRRASRRRAGVDGMAAQGGPVRVGGSERGGGRRRLRTRVPTCGPTACGVLPRATAPPRRVRRHGVALRARARARRPSTTTATLASANDPAAGSLNHSPALLRRARGPHVADARVLNAARRELPRSTTTRAKRGAPPTPAGPTAAARRTLRRARRRPRRVSGTIRRRPLSCPARRRRQDRERAKVLGRRCGARARWQGPGRAVLARSSRVGGARAPACARATASTTRERAPVTAACASPPTAASTAPVSLGTCWARASARRTLAAAELFHRDDRRRRAPPPSPCCLGSAQAGRPSCAEHRSRRCMCTIARPTGRRLTQLHLGRTVGYVGAADEATRLAPTLDSLAEMMSREQAMEVARRAPRPPHSPHQGRKRGEQAEAHVFGPSRRPTRGDQWSRQGPPTAPRSSASSARPFPTAVATQIICRARPPPAAAPAPAAGAYARQRHASSSERRRAGPRHRSPPPTRRRASATPLPGPRARPRAPPATPPRAASEGLISEERTSSHARQLVAPGAEVDGSAARRAAGGHPRRFAASRASANRQARDAALHQLHQRAAVNIVGAARRASSLGRRTPPKASSRAGSARRRPPSTRTSSSASALISARFRRGRRKSSPALNSAALNQRGAHFAATPTQTRTLGGAGRAPSAAGCAAAGRCRCCCVAVPASGTRRLAPGEAFAPAALRSADSSSTSPWLRRQDGAPRAKRARQEEPARAPPSPRIRSAASTAPAGGASPPSPAPSRWPPPSRRRRLRREAQASRPAPTGAQRDGRGRHVPRRPGRRGRRHVDRLPRAGHRGRRRLRSDARTRRRVSGSLSACSPAAPPPRPSRGEALFRRDFDTGGCGCSLIVTATWDEVTSHRRRLRPPSSSRSTRQAPSDESLAAPAAAGGRGARRTRSIGRACARRRRLCAPSQRRRRGRPGRLVPDRQRRPASASASPRRPTSRRSAADRAPRARRPAARRPGRVARSAAGATAAMQAWRSAPRARKQRGTALSYAASRVAALARGRSERRWSRGVEAAAHVGARG